MSGEKQLSDGRPAGHILGQSASDLVGFFGKTPTAQASVASAAIVTLAETPTATDIAVAVNALIARVESIRAKLYDKGHIGQS